MRVGPTITAALGLAGFASKGAPIRPTSTHPSIRSDSASVQSGASDRAPPHASQSSSVPGSGYPFSSASSLAFRRNPARLHKETPVKAPTADSDNVVIKQHDPGMDFAKFNAMNQMFQVVQGSNWSALVQEQNQGADANLQINRG